MVPRSLGDGSIIGTTIIQPQHTQTARKGILKRTAADSANSAAQNDWDYELSAENINKNPAVHHHHNHHNHHRPHNKADFQNGGEPDILQLPMGLPPPPGTTAISGKQGL